MLRKHGTISRYFARATETWYNYSHHKEGRR